MQTDNHAEASRGSVKCNFETGTLPCPVSEARGGGGQEPHSSRRIELTCHCSLISGTTVTAECGRHTLNPKAKPGSKQQKDRVDLPLLICK